MLDLGSILKRVASSKPQPLNAREGPHPRKVLDRDKVNINLRNQTCSLQSWRYEAEARAILTVSESR
jgi:hypothetical protein